MRAVVRIDHRRLWIVSHSASPQEMERKIVILNFTVPLFLGASRLENFQGAVSLPRLELEIETGVEPAASIESGLLRVKFVKVVEDAAIGIPLVIVQRMFKQRQHVSVTIEHQVFADQTA